MDDAEGGSSQWVEVAMYKPESSAIWFRGPTLPDP